jgi:cytochrome c553
MKKTTISVLALLLTLGLGTSLLATMEIQKAFKEKYPEAKALNTKCSTCHTMALPKKDGDHTNNPYGADLAKTKKDGKYDFAAIEKKDSDGDGVSNIDEINKGTNPGDKNSK